MVSGEWCPIANTTHRSPLPTQHPAIQYATRATTDRVARLGAAIAAGSRTLARDAGSGYLLPLLDALGVPAESQLLVFSKTAVQRHYTRRLSRRCRRTSRRLCTRG